MKEFNLLFCLNYSATHKQHHELVYVLDALDAYNKRLGKPSMQKETVKHIFFIAETNGTMETLNLKPIEKAKTRCAKKLFKELSC